MELVSGPDTEATVIHDGIRVPPGPDEIARIKLREAFAHRLQRHPAAVSKTRTKREDGIQHHPGAKDEQLLQIASAHRNMGQKLANHPGVLIPPPFTLKQGFANHMKTQLCEVAQAAVKHPATRRARLIHQVAAVIDIYGIPTVTESPSGHDAIDAATDNGDAFGFRFRCRHRSSHYPKRA